MTTVDPNPATIDIFHPLIEALKEKYMHKMDKIALFGTLSIFIAAYLKARKQIYYF